MTTLKNAATTEPDTFVPNQIFRSYIGMGYHDCITPR
jgi:hypothetical protein